MPSPQSTTLAAPIPRTTFSQVGIAAPSAVDALAERAQLTELFGAERTFLHLGEVLLQLRGALRAGEHHVDVRVGQAEAVAIARGRHRAGPSARPAQQAAPRRRGVGHDRRLALLEVRKDVALGA